MQYEYLWAILIIALICPIAMVWMMRGHRPSDKDVREKQTKAPEAPPSSRHTTNVKDTR